MHDSKYVRRDPLQDDFFVSLAESLLKDRLGKLNPSTFRDQLALFHASEHKFTSDFFRSVKDNPPLDASDDGVVTFPPSAFIPRFAEHPSWDFVDDPTSVLEPDFLARVDGQFGRNLSPSDVPNNVGMDSLRKERSWYYLDALLAHHASNPCPVERGAVVLQCCDLSYVPQMLLRYHKRGVKHVTFLHSKNTFHSTLAEDDLPKVDYHYQFVYGTTSQLSSVIASNNALRALKATLVQYATPDEAAAAVDIELLQQAEEFADDSTEVKYIDSELIMNRMAARLAASDVPDLLGASCNR